MWNLKVSAINVELLWVLFEGTIKSRGQTLLGDPDHFIAAFKKQKMLLGVENGRVLPHGGSSKGKVCYQRDYPV